MEKKLAVVSTSNKLKEPQTVNEVLAPVKKNLKKRVKASMRA
jgi:hypothetical protein